VDQESIAMGKESVSNSTPSGRMLPKGAAFALIITGRVVRHSASLRLVWLRLDFQATVLLSLDSHRAVTRGLSTVVSSSGSFVAFLVLSMCACLMSLMLVVILHT
jgi:hypothetical protein